MFFPSAVSSGRTNRTGTPARRMSSSATLSTPKRLRLPRPCVAITIRSGLLARARSRMPSATVSGSSAEPEITSAVAKTGEMDVSHLAVASRYSCSFRLRSRY
jgi:hypothetical protein